MDQDISSKLQRFELSDKEEGGLVLSVDDVAIGIQDCSLSLIGKIFGRKRDKILEGKTWNFGGQYLLLKPWNSENNEFNEEDEKIKIWVQILNLPLHWISAETWVKLGRLLGKTLDVQVPGIGNYHGQNLKILFELPLSDPILRGTFIKMGEDKKWVDLRYENIQSFYFYCGVIGHCDRSCAKKKEDIDKNERKLGQYGDWLRISSSPISSFRSHSGANLGSQASPEATIPTPIHPIDKSVVRDKSSSGNIQSSTPISHAEKGKANLEGEGPENPGLSKGALVTEPLSQNISTPSMEPMVHIESNLVEG
ncbi:Unknown protein [Striga hermonthica]|uniref:Zinc knuckle CX2CX4HX4C domain-containing protein n=1 Tax=Striga hermonthica TaxID=68872 RepID=A0A9N7R817_STRHE|nr:Unknown protein [Striga hermonthica]